MQLLPLTISGVHKRYGKKPVLRDVGFSVEKGEAFGLIGLNGAGKTTLIKIMLDLCDPDAGAATLFGEPATRWRSRRNLAYLPEHFRPGQQLKGKEFLSLQLSFYGKKYDAERAESYCDRLDLPRDALYRRTAKYSKGMGQKLGLVAAFMCDVPLLVLDEPMSGLDPKARMLLKKLLLESKAKGKTIFFSSHILSDVAEICDRIAVLHNGSVVFCGTPGECVSSYAGSDLEDAFMNAIAA
ncbi:MAG: ABC transporter ATP-binding protein [Rickettsiales bacterium]